MHIEPSKNSPTSETQSLRPVRTDLSSIWVGSDKNVETTVLNGKNGKPEQLWISALSERGLERFVYSNQSREGRGNFNFIPDDVTIEISTIYAALQRRDKTPSGALAEVFEAMSPALWTGFWGQGVGEDMFILPPGLTSTRPVALMPTFAAFCKNPALGRNLFAVASDAGIVGIFINEEQKYSLLRINDAVFKISEAGTDTSSLRDMTFATANLLAQGATDKFNPSVGSFRIAESWEEAGGPCVMLATQNREGAGLRMW